MEPPTAHVALTLAAGRDPISGTVAVERDQPRAFYGWLELITAIDCAYASTRGEAAGRLGACATSLIAGRDRETARAAF